MWGGLTSEYPLTIYKLIRTNLDVLDIPSAIGRGHETFKIKENDFVLFYYGYNDIQKHIAKYENWKEENGEDQSDDDNSNDDDDDDNLDDFLSGLGISRPK